MTTQYIGARYVPAFFMNPNGGWDWLAGFTYEALTLVKYGENTYISRVPVPENIGSPNLNPEYWALTGNYNGAIQELNFFMNRINETFVMPEMFGGIGNGIADDTNALQTAINSNIPVVLMPQKTYLVNNLQLANNLKLMGNGSKLKNNNGKVFNSLNACGYVEISDIVIEQTQPSVICVFYSSINNSIIGGGLNLVNGTATGTLVENKILNTTFRGVGLNTESGTKITDGMISNCIFQVNNNAITIGSSAGWQLSTIHIYGGGTENAINITDAYNTILNSIYIEGYNNAINIRQQLNTVISDCTLSGAIKIILSDYRPDPNDKVLLSNIKCSLIVGDTYATCNVQQKNNEPLIKDYSQAKGQNLNPGVNSIAVPTLKPSENYNRLFRCYIAGKQYAQNQFFLDKYYIVLTTKNNAQIIDIVKQTEEGESKSTLTATFDSTNSILNISASMQANMYGTARIYY